MSKLIYNTRCALKMHLFKKLAEIMDNPFSFWLPNLSTNATRICDKLLLKVRVPKKFMGGFFSNLAKTCMHFLYIQCYKSSHFKVGKILLQLLFGSIPQILFWND